MHNTEMADATREAQPADAPLLPGDQPAWPSLILPLFTLLQRGRVLGNRLPVVGDLGRSLVGGSLKLASSSMATSSALRTLTEHSTALNNV